MLQNAQTYATLENIFGMYKCGEDCGTSSMIGNMVNGDEGVMNKGPYHCSIPATFVVLKPVGAFIYNAL